MQPASTGHVAFAKSLSIILLFSSGRKAPVVTQLTFRTPGSSIVAGSSIPFTLVPALINETQSAMTPLRHPRVDFATLGIYTQLLQVLGHALAHVGEFGLDGVDFLLYGGDVDFFFRFERVDISGDVEVVVVLGDLFRRCDVGKLVCEFAG